MAYKNVDDKRECDRRYSKTEKGRTTRKRNAQTEKGRYANLKYKAKRRKKDFNLSFEEFLTVCNLPCFYCNSKEKNFGHGLDRIKNDKGYSINNIIPCCKVCNTIRSNNLTVEETKYVVTALQAFRKNNG